MLDRYADPDRPARMTVLDRLLHWQIIAANVLSSLRGR
jgi:hypothetical protein